MGLLMRLLLLSIVALPGCTIVLSSTPCDTGTAPTTADSSDSADTGTTPAPAVQLTAGGHHTCALDTDGQVTCWGFDGGLDITAVPDTLADPIELSAGYLFTCALPAAGDTPLCWGDNSAGQATPPGPMQGQLASGGAHACAVTDAGGATCWGRSTEGQTTPPPGVSGASSLALLASGWLFSCAQVGADEAPVCWGHDSDGQSTGPPGSALTAMALGQGFGVGVLALDGTLACWGRDTICDTLPTDPGTTWSHLVAGTDFACALDDTHTAQCWGTNENGVLDAIPTDTFASITAGPGGRHVCGILDDDSGTITCWGLDATGQSSP